MNWAPYSGYRSFLTQDNLYAQGRVSDGPVVTNSRGGESAHNYGCASDFAWFDNSGTLVWLKDNDPKWAELIHVVLDLNLRPGKLFGDIDHVEMKIKIPWSSLLPIYKQSGMDAVNKVIKDNIIA